MSLDDTRRDVLRGTTAAGFAYALSGVRTQAQTDVAADMIVHNGRIVTLAPSDAFAKAFAVKVIRGGLSDHGH